MSYQLIETTVVSGTVLVAVLYAMSRWWPARLQPIKRWRREASSAGCGSGCGGCSSQGGGCSTSSRNEGGVQRVSMPTSRRTAR